MKLFMFICYLCNIVTFKNPSLKRINLILDRDINKISYLDGSEAFGLSLKYDEIKNEKMGMFIWDKYFPKPLFYFFECDMSWNSIKETQLQLKCLSSKGEKIFQFDVTENTGEFENPIFYDIDDKQLNIESRFKSRHEYFISSHEEDIESVKNSIIYTNLLDSVKSCYLILMERFDAFIKVIREFSGKYRNMLAENDDKEMIKVGEVEIALLKMTNSCIKSIASLRIPVVNKLEHVKYYDDFIKNIDNVNNLVEALINDINSKLESYWSNKRNVFHYLNNFKYKITNFGEELKKDEPYSIKDRFDSFFKMLNDVNDFLSEIKSTNKPNTQISLDCDVKKVDLFVENYSSALIEYCDVLEQCDEILVNSYCFSKYLKLDNPYHKPLEDFFADKIISKEMKEYLLHYHVDKIDFLMFSQTDYFKKKLLARIMINLQTLNLTYKLKNEIGKQKYMKRIKDLHQKLQNILKIDIMSGISSFDKIIDSKSYNLHINNTTETKSDDSKDSSLFGATVVVLCGCILCIIICFIIRKVRTND